MTFPPRTGLYLLSSFSDPIASVPYKASYKLPHLAFAAFKAYLAFEIGTTSSVSYTHLTLPTKRIV